MGVNNVEDSLGAGRDGLLLVAASAEGVAAANVNINVAPFDDTLALSRKDKPNRRSFTEASPTVVGWECSLKFAGSYPTSYQIKNTNTGDRNGRRDLRSPIAHASADNMSGAS